MDPKILGAQATNETMRIQKDELPQNIAACGGASNLGHTRYRSRVTFQARLQEHKAFFVICLQP